MKSTQDLAMFLRAVQSRVKQDIALVVTPDKGFDIITVVDGEESKMVHNGEGLDINDLPYMDPKEMAKHINDAITLDVENLRAEDL